jgi:hypothetical protein
LIWLKCGIPRLCYSTERRLAWKLGRGAVVDFGGGGIRCSLPLVGGNFARLR